MGVHLCMLDLRRVFHQMGQGEHHTQIKIVWHHVDKGGVWWYGVGCGMAWYGMAWRGVGVGVWRDVVWCFACCGRGVWRAVVWCVVFGVLW